MLQGASLSVESMLTPTAPPTVIATVTAVVSPSPSASGSAHVDYWPQIITALATLLAAGVTVAVTQFFQVKLAREKRADEHRNYVAEHLVEAVARGRQTAMELAKRRDLHTPEGLVEAMQLQVITVTDLSRLDMQVANEDIREALQVSAKLGREVIVTMRALYEAVNGTQLPVAEEVDSLDAEALAAIRDPVSSESGEDPGAVGEDAYEDFNTACLEYAQSLGRVESVARPYLAIPLELRQRS